MSWARTSRSNVAGGRIGCPHWPPIAVIDGRPAMRPAPMKHPETNCDCTSSAGPLALRWRYPDCGKTAIKKVSTLTTVCDGETVREVECPPSALIGQNG